MNETEFWDAAYRNQAPTLLGVLRRYVKDTNVAQDLLHEVFITAIARYDSFESRGSFEGWLHRISVNTALMYLRNEKRDPVTVESTLMVVAEDEAEDDTDNARSAIEAADFTGEELLSAIDRLPEHHKLVFNMYVMDDFSHKQIGAELNISTNTSKSHLARARKKIQQYLYDDALKKKTKNRRRASAFLLFPFGIHYIDKLYGERLSNFTLTPTGSAEFLSAAVKQHAAQVAVSGTSSATVSGISATATVAGLPSSVAITQTAATAVFWGSKLSYIAACCLTAAITSGVCWTTMSVNSPLHRRGYSSPTLSPLKQSETSTADSCFRASEEDASAMPRNAAYRTPKKIADDALSAVQDVADKDSTARSASDSAECRTPVVVKRQIIQRQTVVVRDTIIVRE